MSRSEVGGPRRLEAVPEPQEAWLIAGRRPLPEVFQHDGVVFDASIFLDAHNLDYSPPSLDLVRYSDYQVGRIGLVVTPESSYLERVILDREGVRGLFRPDAVRIAQQKPSPTGLRNLYHAAVKGLKASPSRETVIVANYHHLEAADGVADHLIAVLKRPQELGYVASMGLYGQTLRSTLTESVMADLKRFSQRDLYLQPPNLRSNLRVL